MSQTTIVQTAKNEITARTEERATMSVMLNGIQSEIQLNHSTDPRGTSLFVKNKNFRKAFRHATGWKGSLTELGFDLIRDQANKDLDGALDADGYPCETKLVTSPWGRLFASIVRILCIQYGEAHCVQFLYRSGGSSALENDHHLATVFAERLVIPQRNQMGIRHSIVQWTLERDLNVKQIFAYIQNNIQGQCGAHFEAVAEDRTFNPFKRYSVVDAFSEDTKTIELADPTNIAKAAREKSSEEHAVSTLCNALRDLPAELKPVMSEWLASVREPELSSKRTFHGQVEGIGNRLGLSRRKAKAAADEIVASMKQSLGVVVIENETETWVPKSKATASRLKNGQLPLRPARADFIRKPVRDDVVTDGLRLENSETMQEFGHDGFAVGTVLNTESTAGSGISAEVLTSDVEDLFRIFFNRNAPFNQMQNALN